MLSLFKKKLGNTKFYDLFVFRQSQRWKNQKCTRTNFLIVYIITVNNVTLKHNFFLVMVSSSLWNLIMFYFGCPLNVQQLFAFCGVQGFVKMCQFMGNIDKNVLSKICLTTHTYRWYCNSISGIGVCTILINSHHISYFKPDI